MKRLDLDWRTASTDAVADSHRFGSPPNAASGVGEVTKLGALFRCLALHNVAFVQLCEPQMSREGEVHRGEVAIETA